MLCDWVHTYTSMDALILQSGNAMWNVARLLLVFAIIHMANEHVNEHSQCKATELLDRQVWTLCDCTDCELPYLVCSETYNYWVVATCVVVLSCR